MMNLIMIINKVMLMEVKLNMDYNNAYKIK